MKTIAIDAKTCCIQTTCLCTAGENICGLKGPKMPGTNSPMNYSDMYSLRLMETNNFLRIFFHNSFRVRVYVSWSYKKSTVFCLMSVGLWLYLCTTLPVYLFLNINQLDALNFIISLFQASTCFEHMCSSSGGLIIIEFHFNNFNYFSNFRPFTCFSVMIPETT